jgi:hypothetical protein
MKLEEAAMKNFAHRISAAIFLTLLAVACVAGFHSFIRP